MHSLALLLMDILLNSAHVKGSVQLCAPAGKGAYVFLYPGAPIGSLVRVCIYGCVCVCLAQT